MSYKLGVLFCTLIICLDALAIAPTLRSQHGDTCIYDDGTVLKSLSCPLRLRFDENKKESRPLLDNNSPGTQMLIESAARSRELMGRGVRGLLGGDIRTPEEIHASAIIQKQQKQQQVFANYLSKKYPNSGLDILALEGIVTPENFKDFLTE